MPVIKYKTKEEELQARVDAMAKPKFATKAEEETQAPRRSDRAPKRASRTTPRPRRRRRASPRRRASASWRRWTRTEMAKVSAEMLAGGSRVLKSAGSAISAASGMDLDGDGVVTAAEVAEAARIQKEKGVPGVSGDEK